MTAEWRGAGWRGGAGRIVRGMIAALAALALGGCADAFNSIADRATDAIEVDGVRGYPQVRLEVSEAPAELIVVDVRRRGLVWSQNLLRRLVQDDVQILILGEVHDNPQHHRIQAWLVESLNQIKQRGAWLQTDFYDGVGGLAFEMIPEPLEAEVNAARSRRFLVSRRSSAVEQAEQVAAIVDWNASGWPDFAQYAPIFVAAPGAYLGAGGVDRDTVRGLAANPVATPDAEAAGLLAALPPGEQQIRESLQIRAHCDALPADVAPRLVTGQRIRDLRLAAAALRAFEQGGGFTVMIAGAGHARLDWGAPRYLARLAPEIGVVSIGMVEVADPGLRRDLVGDRRPGAVAALMTQVAAQFGVETPPFDYIIVTAPPQPPRPDPCAAFR